jgi:hypothetical protein
MLARPRVTREALGALDVDLTPDEMRYLDLAV